MLALLVGLLGALPVSGSPQPADSRYSALGFRTGMTKEIRQSSALEMGISPGYSILNMSEDQLNRTLDVFEEMGMRWLRIDLDWSAVERTRGHFDWSKPDRVVKAARARDMQVLAILTAAPGWATRKARNTATTSTVDFAHFARVAAARYENRIAAWEVWNEANLTDFWKPYPRPDRYASLLIAASAAIKASDPGAIVLTTGMAPVRRTRKNGHVNAKDFLTALYRNGARDSFDGVSFHPYTYPKIPTDTATWNAFLGMKDLREIMVRNGDAAKQIWLTEFGAPTGTARKAVSQQRQATIMSEAIHAARALPWAGPLMIYGGVDKGRNRASLEDNFGVVTADFKPKLAYSAILAAMGS